MIAEIAFNYRKWKWKSVSLSPLNFMTAFEKAAAIHLAAPAAATNTQEYNNCQHPVVTSSIAPPLRSTPDTHVQTHLIRSI